MLNKSKFPSYFLLFLGVLLPSLHLMFSSLFGSLCHRNSGVSFGFLGDQSVIFLLVLQFLFIIIIGIVSVILSVKFFSMQWVRVIVVSITAASFANLLDRAVFGGVCDYFRLAILGKQIFFNINDIIIVLIIAILIINEVKSGKDSNR